MRTMGRSLIVVILIAGLVEMPVLASPSASLGTVVYAKEAQFDSVPAVGGATVFPGDKLETGQDGSARVRAGSGQIYLLASSAATFSNQANGISAVLQRGTAGFSSSGEAAVELRIAEAILRPKTSEPTHGRVTVLSPKQLIVSSFHGPLELRVGDETYTIAENTAYRVDFDSGEQGPEGYGSHTARRSSAVLTLIALGVAGGFVGWVVARAIVSPHKIF